MRARAFRPALAGLLLLAAVLAGCDRAGPAGADPERAPPLPAAATAVADLLPGGPSRTPAPERIRFAVIGDYGVPADPAADVAELVAGWNPDFVLTVGDNNYVGHGVDALDRNVGRYYHQFIGNYRGEHGDGSDDNRFFPTLGNHDWEDPAGIKPYLEYFTLPSNERYYTFAYGPARFFALSSDPAEPDGVVPTSRQGRWFRQALADSRACWDITYFHHPPYSSARHGQSEWMQWPFAEWGADLVLAGHDHTYERIVRDGLPYIINGLGGAGIYAFREQPAPGSVARFNDDHGALLVTIEGGNLTLEFVTRTGRVVDTDRLEKSCPA